MSIDFNKIPAEMRLYLQWVVWRYEDRATSNEGTVPTKVPYDAKTGEPASVSDPRTWTSFVQAVDACDRWRYHGIGFVFTQHDPFSGIDLDDVQKKVEAGVLTADEAAVIYQRQIKVYEEFNSYAEKSPSGRGLHIIVKGKVPTGRRRSQMEVYSEKRFFTMTGDVYRDAPIEPCQELLTLLWQQMGKGVAAAFYDGKVPQKESDEVVIERALKARNGEKFAVLVNGNWSQLYPSHSEADLAFIDIVAYYTQNREQIARIFRASPLGKRRKAQRGDYVDWMINKSFDNMLPPIEIDNLAQQLRLELTPNDAAANANVQENPFANHPPVIYDNGDEPLLPGLESDPAKDVLNTLPAGLVGEIASFIYRSSPYPMREDSLCAALGLMAGVCGRSYNTYTGAGLNLYLLLLAQTGTGKEAISLGPARLINALGLSCPNAKDFIGPSNFQSMPALIKWLAAKPSIIATMNEFGLAICQMSSRFANPNALALKKGFLEIFPKSDAGASYEPLAYSDKANNTVTIQSPSLSILGESVPEEFYKNLDETVISGGLLPRFLIIEVPQGLRPEFNENANNIKPELGLLDNLSKLMASSLVMNSGATRKVLKVDIASDAKELLDDFRKTCDAQMRHAGGKDVVRQLWNRAHLKALKVSSLLAIGCDMYFPIIALEQAQWAKDLVIKDVLNILGRFMRGEIGVEGSDQKQIADMKAAIVGYFKAEPKHLVSYQVPADFRDAGLVTYGYLQRRLVAQAAFRNDRMGATNAIQRTIRSLCDSGILEEVPKKQLQDRFNGMSPKSYAVSDVRQLKG